MRGTYKIQDADNIDCTLTVTMTVKQWEELSEQLNETYPSWQLSSMVNKMTREARQTIFADSPRDVSP